MADRNLTDDQRSILLNKMVEARSKIAMTARNKKAGESSGEARNSKSNMPDTVSGTLEAPLKPHVRDRSRESRGAVAKEQNVPERKLRYAAEITKKANANK